MRARVFIVLYFLVTMVFSQSKTTDRVSASFSDAQLETILELVSDQTGYFFSYNSDVLPKGSKYSISAENEPVDQFLSRLLTGTGLKYSFFKDQIILNYEPPEIEVIKKNLFSISGTVLDENGDPLRGVNVFLDGTTIGSFTDIDGNYLLESIPPGLYDLVFSHLGYENEVYQISEYGGGSRIQKHQMKVDLIQLEEVKVVSSIIRSGQSAWQAHYQVFREELLGTSSNARNCVIENPEEINFSYTNQSQTLTASAARPIIIRNDALGYRINYILESFEKSGDNLRYRGKINFRNLEPLSAGNRRLWRKNRKSSYYGSFNHFKKVLLKENDLRKQGFRIYGINNLKDTKTSRADELDRNDIIVFRGNYYELSFKNYLKVEYRKEKESLDFLKDSDFVNIIYDDYIDKNGILKKDPSHQMSVIKLLRNGVRLDLNGQILDKFALTSYGYWSWERLGDLVPLNYDPKSDKL